MADLDTYGDEPRYEDDRDNYATRDRSRSPMVERDGDNRIREEPANGRGDRDSGPAPRGGDDGQDSQNSGSNLFVTGIHPRLTEEEVTRLFEKYGVVEKCNIMKDPHTRESRGFGFVKMTTSEEADAAKENLQGEVYEGRTLSIEKARRGRPRTPTPGKYFGPPKRDDRPPRGGGGYRDRYDDRGYGGGRRDDFRRGGGGGYRDRYDDRGYGGGRRDDYGGPPRGGDRYRDDRYGDDRRGGGYGGGRGGGYERGQRGPPADASGYSGGSGGDAGGAPSRDAPPRDYERGRYD